jgi:enoyl-[acyl-carrier protein] reductase I
MDRLHLEGKKGLIVGIANDKSIAYGCARIMRNWGAELAVTYLNEKAEKHVRPLAENLSSPIILPCDVQKPEQVHMLFDAIRQRWGKLDFLLHSIAFAPKDDLQGRLLDCSLQGFLTAMDVSCHSFLRLSKLAEPLMKDGGSLLTVTYMGSSEVVSHYNIMGPVKAALESVVRYMAAELGSKNIRVNALSPGAMPTRAASGIEGFDNILQHSQQKAPLHRLIDLNDVGYMAAFLASDAAKNITGGVHIIDAGYGVMD